MLASTAIAQVDTEKRQAYLGELQEMIEPSPPFEQWLEDTGELPPNFSEMPSQAWLPDPLEPYSDEFETITCQDEWEAWRPELKQLFHHWVIGTMPPRPDNLKAEVLSETAFEGGTVREVELRFGPDHQAKLWAEFYIPAGDGPHPVFITQDNHRAWGLIALRRGYLTVVYAGSDSRDDTHTFIDAYPEHDWSKLLRRAWAASRCIDYLETEPKANLRQVAMTGHSRNGKMSLMASAMDERIKAVISSSSGAGGCNPARLFSEQHFGEGIELLTRRFPDWFHPRLRFFTGREHKLPVDFHQLVALTAPRACLISTAVNDGVESTWAVERMYTSVKPVYELYGADEKLRIMYRAGGHATWPTVIERYLDWCDLEFERGDYVFEERYLHPWDWESWKERAKPLNVAEYPERDLSDVMTLRAGAPVSAENYDQKRAEVREVVRDMLGDEPPNAPAPRGTYGESPYSVEVLLGRSSSGKGLTSDDVVFGEYLNADIYRPSISKLGNRKLPAILWLHPLNNSRGYVASYRRGEQAFRRMAEAGYAVFAFDQTGHGRRIEETEHFYDHHPDWSILGKMVRDAQHALDVMEEVEFIDTDQVYIVGYAMGALVAQHLAALDDRPAGVVSVCGPPPFRLDRNVAETGGIARWAQHTMWLPKLGYFVGEEARVPYDVHELIAAAAPKPYCVVAPTLDREAKLSHVQHAVGSARQVYEAMGAEDNLTILSPDTYNHFDPEMQDIVLDWLKQHAPVGDAVEE